MKEKERKKNSGGDDDDWRACSATLIGFMTGKGEQQGGVYGEIGR